jgi:hypothetical protein
MMMAMAVRGKIDFGVVCVVIVRSVWFVASFVVVI